MMIMLTAALPGSCQDLVALAPEAVKVEYEDARVRVMRVQLAANASLPMHERAAGVVIPLKSGEVRITSAEGKTSVVRSAAGTAKWSERLRGSVSNLGVALEEIVVELKGATDPAKPLASPPAPRPAGYLDEKFHHWFFENQYVRVYDVRIPPGETTEFHLHAFDSVFVVVSGGLVAIQAEGQAWGKAETTEAGSVEFSADAKRPRTHRVRNDGRAEFHVVVVQLLE